MKQVLSIETRDLGKDIGKELPNVLKNALENALENVLKASASLAASFNVNERTIRQDLSVLQAMRIICHIGPDKGGRWIILNDIRSNCTTN